MFPRSRIKMRRIAVSIARKARKRLHPIIDCTRELRMQIKSQALKNLIFTFLILLATDSVCAKTHFLSDYKRQNRKEKECLHLRALQLYLYVYKLSRMPWRTRKWPIVSIKQLVAIGAHGALVFSESVTSIQSGIYVPHFHRFWYRV